MVNSVFASFHAYHRHYHFALSLTGAEFGFDPQTAFWGPGLESAGDNIIS